MLCPCNDQHTSVDLCSMWPAAEISCHSKGIEGGICVQVWVKAADQHQCRTETKTEATFFLTMPTAWPHTHRHPALPPSAHRRELPRSSAGPHPRHSSGWTVQIHRPQASLLVFPAKEPTTPIFFTTSIPLTIALKTTHVVSDTGGGRRGGWLQGQHVLNNRLARRRLTMSEEDGLR